MQYQSLSNGFITIYYLDSALNLFRIFDNLQPSKVHLLIMPHLFPQVSRDPNEFVIIAPFSQPSTLSVPFVFKVEIIIVIHRFCTASTSGHSLDISFKS